MDEPPDTEIRDPSEPEAWRRHGDGAQAWLGLLIVIASAAACAVAIVFAVWKWAAL